MLSYVSLTGRPEALLSHWHLIPDLAHLCVMSAEICHACCSGLCHFGRRLASALPSFSSFVESDCSSPSSPSTTEQAAPQSVQWSQFAHSMACWKSTLAMMRYLMRVLKSSQTRAQPTDSASSETNPDWSLPKCFGTHYYHKSPLSSCSVLKLYWLLQPDWV